MRTRTRPRVWHRTVRRSAARGTLALIALAGGVGPARAADQQQVQRAIDAGRDYLFKTQRNGNWEVVPAPDPKATISASVLNGQWGGMTGVATLALLAAGVPPTDPRLAPAIDFLRKADLTGTYAVAVRAQVWGQLPSSEPWLRRAAMADRDRLLGGVRTGRGDAQGFYGYQYAGRTTDFDHSASQYAVLGMWSLEQAGVEVPTGYWHLVDDAWHRQQLPTGGWSYYAKPTDQPQEGQTVSMTAAGLATLYVTQEYTRMAAQCGGNVDDPAIDAGLRVLGQDLTALPAERRYYALFGVSRVGLASGRKFLGATDWFQWGADLAVRDQHPDGSWGSARGDDNWNNVPNTALALLFLARGRVPVMMTKLAYDVVPAAGAGRVKTPGPPAGTWDQRPRDVANLTRWVGRQIESPLAWQVADLRHDDADLHDSPILFMAGGTAPRLSDADAARVRTYLEDGGLLVGHADCGSAEFANGFRQLGERLCPGRRFRPLEPTSPIYTAEAFPRDKWPSKPPVEALSNGCRELIVLLPNGDPGRQWQTRSFLGGRKDVYGQFMADLFLYAVDNQGLRRRGETYLAARRQDVPAGRPVRVARLSYAGNWDPEPGGWRRLANVLHNAVGVELDVRPVDPAAAAGALTAAAFPLASLTIADADFRLTDAARAAVLAYVQSGGTLLVDAAGGRPPYRSAAEAELARLFPGSPHPWPVLPPDDPVFAAATADDLAVKSVDYRRFERPSTRLHVAQLRGLAVGGRTGVFYSPEDVSVGLVGQPIDGVAGYVPADATKIVAAVVAYAAKPR